MVPCPEGEALAGAEFVCSKDIIIWTQVNAASYWPKLVLIKTLYNLWITGTHTNTASQGTSSIIPLPSCSNATVIPKSMFSSTRQWSQDTIHQAASRVSEQQPQV